MSNSCYLHIKSIHQGYEGFVFSNPCTEDSARTNIALKQTQTGLRGTLKKANKLDLVSLGQSACYVQCQIAVCRVRNLNAWEFV